MHADEEYDGARCVILPADYMASVDAAVELYDEDIERRSTSFEVNGLQYGAGRLLFRAGLAASLLWLLPSLWMLCV